MQYPSYDEVEKKVFATAEVHHEVPKVLGNGAILWTKANTTHRVGLAFDESTNRVYRVMELFHAVEEHLPPFQNLRAARKAILASSDYHRVQLTARQERVVA